MGIFNFGRGSRNQDETPPPPRQSPTPPIDDDPNRRDESFLTGDERIDSKNISMLLDTIAEVNSRIELSQVLISIVDKAIVVTRSERGFLLLRDKDQNGVDTKEISIHVARDAAGRDLPRETRYSTKVVSQVEASLQPIHSMVNSDAKALELSQSVFDLKIRAVMCVPLLVKGKFLGAIYVDSRVVQREFTKPDLKFFAAFAAQAAVALENARLLRDSLEKERMAGELRIAQQIQKRMLPASAPRTESFDCYGSYEPASEATGDSYDFIILPNNQIVFVITDVSGHGLGPALVTMGSRARLRSYLGMGLTIGEAVTRLNGDLQSEVDVGMFQTLFIGVVDTKSGRLQYVNAGHPPALLRRANGGAFIELQGGGAALGLVDGEIYKPSEYVEWNPGDFLVAFTDGITEARPAAGGELYGDDRLRATIAQKASSGAKEMVDEIVQSVRRFCGGPSNDDLTLVAIRRTS